MGIVVKSAIALGAVYVAMFGSGATERALTRTASVAACSAAASAAPAAASAACADALSAQARQLLLARFQAAAAPAEARPAPATQTLTRADLAEPWSGPAASRRKLQKRRGVALRREQG